MSQEQLDVDGVDADARTLNDRDMAALSRALLQQLVVGAAATPTASSKAARLKPPSFDSVGGTALRLRPTDVPIMSFESWARTQLHAMQKRAKKRFDPAESVLALEPRLVHPRPVSIPSGEMTMHKAMDRVVEAILPLIAALEATQTGDVTDKELVLAASITCLQLADLASEERWITSMKYRLSDMVKSGELRTIYRGAESLEQAAEEARAAAQVSTAARQASAHEELARSIARVGKKEAAPSVGRGQQK